MRVYNLNIEQSLNTVDLLTIVDNIIRINQTLPLRSTFQLNTLFPMETTFTIPFLPECCRFVETLSFPTPTEVNTIGRLRPDYTNNLQVLKLANRESYTYNQLRELIRVTYTISGATIDYDIYTKNVTRYGVKPDEYQHIKQKILFRDSLGVNGSNSKPTAAPRNEGALNLPTNLGDYFQSLGVDIFESLLYWLHKLNIFYGTNLPSFYYIDLNGVKISFTPKSLFDGETYRKIKDFELYGKVNSYVDFIGQIRIYLTKFVRDVWFGTNVKKHILFTTIRDSTSAFSVTINDNVTRTYEYYDGSTKVENYLDYSSENLGKFGKNRDRDILENIPVQCVYNTPTIAMGSQYTSTRSGNRLTIVDTTVIPQDDRTIYLRTALGSNAPIGVYYIVNATPYTNLSLGGAGISFEITRTVGGPPISLAGPVSNINIQFPQSFGRIVTPIGALTTSFKNVNYSFSTFRTSGAISDVFQVSEMPDNLSGAIDLKPFKYTSSGIFRVSHQVGILWGVTGIERSYQYYVNTINKALLYFPLAGRSFKEICGVDVENGITHLESILSVTNAGEIQGKTHATNYTVKLGVISGSSSFNRPGVSYFYDDGQNTQRTYNSTSYVESTTTFTGFEDYNGKIIDIHNRVEAQEANFATLVNVTPSVISSTIIHEIDLELIKNVFETRGSFLILLLTIGEFDHNNISAKETIEELFSNYPTPNPQNNSHIVYNTTGTFTVRPPLRNIDYPLYYNRPTLQLFDILNVPLKRPTFRPFL